MTSATQAPTVIKPTASLIPHSASQKPTNSEIIIGIAKMENNELYLTDRTKHDSSS